ncbi:hypothetical protein O181_072240 [Austropuccinia psidii MF-1]|uniref:Methyltransferase domain-containing protein n=1 Tax=Austropuccinia psidii MF-1 TaxID=1389203 RepID=A0A9Q3IAU5_9BASI|nr:hypothetical protein [Austropuccinia psidii MF-1]
MAQTCPRLEQRAFEKGADVSAVNKLHMIGRLEDNYVLDRPENINQLEFFRAATGISDRQRLKDHIISIAKEAYDVFPYPCIWALYFCQTRVITHPAYPTVLELAQKIDDVQPIFLDVGSFAGIDLRQVIHTGMKRENVLGTDLIDDWAKIGDKLFNENKLVPFIKGDIFDNSFLDPSVPPLPKNNERALRLDELSSLDNLKQRVRFITCNSVFHLFDEPGQAELARRLASLLDNARKGSTIFGTHVGASERCIVEQTGERGMFMHSPQTWKQMWQDIYQQDEARIEVELGPPEPITHLKDFRSMTMLIWRDWFGLAKI